MTQSAEKMLSDLSPAWRNEIQKRLNEIDAGTVKLRDAAEVFENAYRSLK